MKFKKTLLTLASLTLILGLGSCGGQDGPKLEKKEILFHNESDGEYTLENDKITTYFYPGQNVPLVGIKTIIDELDGYFLSEKLLVDIDKENNKAKYSWTEEDYEFTLDVDCTNETMSVNSSAFFNLVDMPAGITYDGHFEEVDTYANEVGPLTFDLKPYNFDLFLRGDDVIMPLNIFNTLFMMANIGSLIYNGEEYYLYTSYLGGDEDMMSSRNQVLEGQDIPLDVLEARNNGLYFLLDYFYGLKEVKGISSFKEYIEGDPELKKLFNSQKATDFEKGMVSLLLTDFDDPHTSTGLKSIYSRRGEKGTISMEYKHYNLGERYKGLINTLQDLYMAYDSAFSYYRLVRFEGNTAFIKFDEFMVGSDEELYMPDGSLKPTAWQHDTFYLMKKALEEVRDNKDVKNVVLDLSQNTGGVLAACYNALGFLTDEDILLPMADILTKEENVVSIRIDTDEDKDYTDKDAFTGYNYYILASNGTFSAANFFTSVCRDMGLATIIGHKSGGGMCSVGQASLLDGSTFNFSSNFCLNGQKKDGEDYVLNEIETGIDVEHVIEYDKYYDLPYLVNLINNDFKA